MQHHKDKQLHLIGWNDEVDSLKKITAVVISIRCGETLDNKYHNNHFQSADSNEKVLIATATDFQILKIVHLLRGDHVAGSTFKILRKALTKVPPSRVVINWENSQGFSSGIFLSGKQLTFELIHKALERGYTQIFSGYSLMTLLENWDAHILGQNVFSEIQIPENKPVSIKFDIQRLKQQSSDRFNVLGEILDNDQVTFVPKKFSCKYCHKLGSNLGEKFQLKVLSINTSNPSLNQKQNHHIQGATGSYGHIMLQYKSHGRLIFSASNFSELSDMKVNEDKLWASMQKRKGAHYVQETKKQYESAQNKKETLRHLVSQYLRSLLPC